ncbi:hypothetical protein BDV36DRAFT_262832 [Aspergillus pseudocaelatus]|uniref:Uncharacterized protein n=1 Tax=Aspergillus pseudocaelatus TaxID=1825620 RepID=A0ABQ6WEE5_9EURO|nr:hypothetical protein BDV36DRAFT_262832 [Aspergillus pseudocaelatus]
MFLSSNSLNSQTSFQFNEPNSKGCLQDCISLAQFCPKCRKARPTCSETYPARLILFSFSHSYLILVPGYVLAQRIRYLH